MHVVIQALIYSGLILAWLHGFFLGILDHEATIMHQQQLDPTEIIVIPYDLSRLFIYTTVVVLFAIVSNGTVILSRLPLVTSISAGCAWLCGASVYENHWHTVLGALYFGTLCMWDPPVFSKDSSTRTVVKEFQHRHLAIPRSSQEVLAQTVLHGVVAGAVPLQILLLYDRGWQMQRWPVPLVLGSTVGWVGGIIVGTVRGLYRSQQSKK